MDCCYFVLMTAPGICLWTALMWTSTPFGESEFDELLNILNVCQSSVLSETSRENAVILFVKEGLAFWEKCLCFHANSYRFHSSCLSRLQSAAGELSMAQRLETSEEGQPCPVSREQKSTSWCLRRWLIIAFYLLNPYSGFLKPCRWSERLEKVTASSQETETHMYFYLRCILLICAL